MITQLPRLESRIGAQEHMTTVLHARIQGLSEDMTTTFQRVQDDQLQNSRKIDALSQDMVASFTQLASYQNPTESKIDERFGKIEEDIAEIKATMATKEDLAAVKAAMATKEDLAAVKEDLAAIKGDMRVMEKRMDQRMLALEGRVDLRIDALQERMLESFKQMMVMIDMRLPPAQ